LRLDIRTNPLVLTLFEVKGNARSCLLTEPLWGIPFNLYAPFVTLYMYALGVNDRQIGFLLSISMVLQVISASLGGIMTDKYGRRRVTFLVDLIAWSVPVLIWMLAQDFWWFFAAAVFNSLFQMTSTSWQCLMVEDCDPKLLVNLYTWVNISGLLAVFFAPLSALFVAKFSLVATVRVLYAVAFILMTVKFFILYHFSTETGQGKKRMLETKDQSIWQLFVGYRDIFRKMAKSRQMLLIMAVFVLINIVNIPVGNFFSLYITQNVGIPEKYVALFPIGRAMVMLLFIFVFQTMFNRFRYRPVLLWGIMLYIASHVMLLLARPGNGWFIVGYTVLEAAAFALVIPRRDSLGVLFIDKEDRARVMSLIVVVMLAVSSPFGSLIGWLSSIDRRYPFMLNIGIFAVLALIVSTSRAISQHDCLAEAGLAEAEPVGQ